MSRQPEPVERIAGAHDLDEWGLDPTVYDLAVGAARLRWKVDLGGHAHLPADGGALVVLYRRVGLSEAAVLGAALQQATGRRTRTIGMPDWPVVGSLARRLGGGVDHPDEVRGMLAAGEVVVVGLGRQPLHGGVAGPVRAELVAPAADLDVPVLPAIATGWEVGRRWRVRLGAPVPGETAAALAAAARDGVNELLVSD